ncbi:hypothetical protein T11_12083 [Trichinella zimbabwensis]|uniref:T20D4.11-like domain-containing protein n=1 Tax=Trichinella zimbabwensis TaxID=268475 RepID=A0A0V1I7T1_9BILA|nr:hypothetical protein T11_12083 [Trichinella zimbabwensis]
MMFELLMHMFAFIYFIGFAKLLNGDESCEESVLSKIKQCTSPVEEYVDLISTTLPIRIWKFQSCIDPLKLFCPEQKTVNFIYTTYGYLCDEGYSDFLHNIECFLFVESESDTRECLQNVSTQTVTFHKGAISRSSTEQACKLVQDFLNCVKIPVRRRCGKRAWNLIFRLFMATSRILLLQCKMDVQENFFINKLFLTNEFSLENRQTSLSHISIIPEHIFKNEFNSSGLTIN